MSEILFNTKLIKKCTKKRTQPIKKLNFGRINKTSFTCSEFEISVTQTQVDQILKPLRILIYTELYTYRYIYIYNYACFITYKSRRKFIHPPCTMQYPPPSMIKIYRTPKRALVNGIFESHFL